MIAFHKKHSGQNSKRSSIPEFIGESTDQTQKQLAAKSTTNLRVPRVRVTNNQILPYMM